MKTIILATSNSGKIAELAEMLAASGIEVLGLDAFPQIGEIEENGATFEENALIKAMAVAKATGLAALADDSGLMVDALEGAPGVYSARYGLDWAYLPGENRDQRNMRKLLHEMANVPAGRRQCHFVTAMAAVKPGVKPLVCRGEWQGELLGEPLGSNGFGYDPVFFDPQIQKSAAQLSREEKNSRSHRGRALACMLRLLPQYLGD